MSLACTCSPGQRASGPSAQVFAATGWGPAPQALTASDAAGCSCLPPEGLRLAQSRPLFPVALPACLDICSPNNICHKSSPRLQGGLAGGRAAKPAPWLHKGASTTVCFLAATDTCLSGRGGLRSGLRGCSWKGFSQGSPCSNSHCCNSWPLGRKAI